MSTRWIRAAVILAAGAALLCHCGLRIADCGLGGTPPGTQAAVRFGSVDVYVDSGTQPLAAWQVEVVARGGEVKIVGIEGGAHPAYKEPAYYDPAALKGGRIILTAFSTAGELPTGRTRVACVNYQVSGDGSPKWTVKLMTAASHEGARIQAAATVETEKGDNS